MNGNQQTTSQTFSPLRYLASEANLKSGSEMKHRWIGQVLKDIHRTNARMVRARRNAKSLPA